MSIYERPTKSLMVDWAKENLPPGQTFKKSAAMQWFAKEYPKIKSNTVNMHVEGMAVILALRLGHEPAHVDVFERALTQRADGLIAHWGVLS
jgi:endonuclease